MTQNATGRAHVTGTVVTLLLEKFRECTAAHRELLAKELATALGTEPAPTGDVAADNRMFTALITAVAQPGVSGMNMQPLRFPVPAQKNKTVVHDFPMSYSMGTLRRFLAALQLVGATRLPKELRELHWGKLDETVQADRVAKIVAETYVKRCKENDIVEKERDQRAKSKAAAAKASAVKPASDLPLFDLAQTVTDQRLASVEAQISSLAVAFAKHIGVDAAQGAQVQLLKPTAYATAVSPCAQPSGLVPEDAVQPAT